MPSDGGTRSCASARLRHLRFRYVAFDSDWLRHLLHYSFIRCNAKLIPLGFAIHPVEGKDYSTGIQPGDAVSSFGAGYAGLG